MLSTPTALPTAIDALQRRVPTGTRLGTADLDRLPLTIKRRSFFSAKVESVRFLALAKAELQKTVNQFGINRDRASFIANLQAAAQDLGLDREIDPQIKGTLLDITSRRRLGLIYDIQVGLAQGEAAHRAGIEDPDLFNFAPAQELVRVREVVEPRDWPARWAEAGGQFYNGRMIARKDNPIWSAISRFGLPWPPFDFQSGMGVADVSRRDAITLGVAGVPAKGPIEAATLIDNEGNDLSVGLTALSDDEAADLQQSFGAAAVLDSGARRLTLDQRAISDWMRDPEPGTAFDLGDIPLAGPARRAEIRADDIEMLLAQPNAPTDPQDWDLISGLLWLADRSSFAADAVGGGERVTLESSAGRGRAVWSAVLHYAQGELVGRLLNFLKYTP